MISFPLLLVFFCRNEVIWSPVGLLFTTFGNLTSYYIWNIQASNFSSVPYLKDFGAFQLEFETVELY